METLDKFDLAILHELQTDARLTNAELSTRVGLSAATLLAARAGAGRGRLHHRLPGRDQPPQNRAGRAGLCATGRRAQTLAM